jgi:hypothetical protein
MSDDTRLAIVVETQSETGWRSMALELPRGTWELGEIHEFAKTAAEAAGVLTEETTEVTVKVSFPVT